MRLNDARLRQRRTKALYPNHRLPPWLTEDATRDRSNRLLGLSDAMRVDLRDQFYYCLQSPIVSDHGDSYPNYRER
jgi:hypothetical protein